MDENAFQDYYAENTSHCYGCGRLNEHGLQLKSYWDGDESVATFTPKPYHIAIPGYVYGGLLASLIDCHGTGTAAAAAYKAAGRSMDSMPAFRYVTGSLHVDYLKPKVVVHAKEVKEEIKPPEIKIGPKPSEVKFEEVKNALLGNIIKVSGRVKKNEMFQRIDFVANNVDPKPDPGKEIEKLKNEQAVQ